MSIDRRQFLSAAAVAGGLSVWPVMFGSEVARAQQSLSILILGGTGFLGPHTVQYALERGHDVTLFNRGRTNTDLFWLE